MTGPNFDERIAMLMRRDSLVLARRARSGRGQAALRRDVEAAERRLAGRQAAAAAVRRNAPDLPITSRRDDIMAAIRDHPVVVVAGETGSGKSTQLPQLCLELGRGVRGMIGHTQPRRLAARAVAERIAEEVGTEVGGTVGYAVRFTDRVGDRTLVKVMTDGILLNEIHRDRDLDRYDTIIIDEAHERGLNVDFLLGYVTQLLPRRPDLRVIVTSATIDTERFADHFGGAPVVTVSGRSYPVELRYRPVVDDTHPDRDQVQAVLDAVDELTDAGPGDVLVFLSGEREIRDTAEALERRGGDLDVLPLYARLSIAEQHRVFQPHAKRRVVLATNVAETSLTVPGIRFVVDAGTARISRYGARSKVQRLPIEAVSQASANQRAGRCGRVAPGVCIRLYDEEDFEARPAFTDPEILRTNLASVILQMAALDLGEVGAFPFVDPPDARSVRDGEALLRELGAFSPEETARPVLTVIGRRLARLPLDPRLGRMLLEAERLGCAREVTVLVAGLAIQDPRERPTDAAAAADAAHARFTDGGSDFIAFLRLWAHLEHEQAHRSSSSFRRMCRAEFLNYLRVREWQDLVGQLGRVLADLRITRNEEPADERRIHQAVLAGLLGQLGMRDPAKRDYQGARGTRFSLAAGSSLAAKPPRWVMAAEIVETNRPWARVAGPVRPEWAERLAPHLVRRTYGEARWDRGRAMAVTTERVSLYGLPIVTGRVVPVGGVDPALARQLFIEHALVEGDWRGEQSFSARNRAVLDHVRALADKSRRPDLAVGDDALLDAYQGRVPDTVVSGVTFDRWFARQRTDVLDVTVADVLPAGTSAVDPDDFPDRWTQGALTFPVTYRFAPGEDDDGVTVHLPVARLNQITGGGFDWHVPGWRAERVSALLRTLPKQLRRGLVPVREHADRFLDTVGPADGPLLDLLGRYVASVTGEPVPRGAWRDSDLPRHLRVTFAAEDGRGRVVATGADLDRLRTELDPEVRTAIRQAAPSLAVSGARSWTFGDLPPMVEEAGVRAYPALVDEGETVGVRLCTSPAEQRATMWAGTHRLLRLTAGSVASALRRVPNRVALDLARARHGSTAQMLDACVSAAVDQLLAVHGGPVWDAAAFAKLRSAVGADISDAVLSIATQTASVLATSDRVTGALDGVGAPSLRPAVEDMRAQIARLVPDDLPRTPGADRLPDIERYLRAAEHRLQKLPQRPARDAEHMASVQALEAAIDATVRRLRSPVRRAEARQLRWMVEELRVSLFAQPIGSRYPVSVTRVRRALAEFAA